jgi:hypothetical protein
MLLETNIKCLLLTSSLTCEPHPPTPMHSDRPPAQHARHSLRCMVGLDQVYLSVAILFGSSNTSRYRRPPSSSEVSRNTSHTSEISWHRRPNANSLSRTPAFVWRRVRTTTGSGHLVANVKHIIIIGVGLLLVVDSGGRVLPALQYGRQATG